MTSEGVLEIMKGRKSLWRAIRRNKMGAGGEGVKIAGVTDIRVPSTHY